MDPAQSILRKAPPADMEKNLKGLKDSLKDNPDALEAMMKKHQIPFQVLEVPKPGERPFLLCRYNRVGDKHRSPWTNKLHDPDAVAAGPGRSKPIKVAVQPAGRASSSGIKVAVVENPHQDEDDLRRIEENFNEVWDAYKSLYYGGEAVGSVYLRDTEKGEFQGLCGIRKACSSGSWHSVHLIHVDTPEEKSCNYRVDSSVLVVLEPSHENATVNISACLSKEVTRTCKVEKSILVASHIENLGKLIEANEIDIRSSLERVHIPKTQEIMDSVEKKESKMPTQVNPLMAMMMNSDVLKKRRGAG